MIYMAIYRPSEIKNNVVEFYRYYQLRHSQKYLHRRKKLTYKKMDCPLGV